MRWIFIAVVALNILYLGWSIADPVQPVGDGDGEVPQAIEYPQKLGLVGEAGGVSPAPAPGAPGRPVAGCPAVGPLSEADGARVMAALQAAGYETGARMVETRSARVFWVYIPQFPDRAQALRKLRELQAKGVDSFLVAEGADANAISLGSFTAKDSALGVQARLRSAGYGAEIREETRNVQQGWVVLAEPGAQGYLEHIPADLRDKLRQDRLECALAR